MKQSSVLMLFLILAIGASAIAIFISFLTFTINHPRTGPDDPQTQAKEGTIRRYVSDDPSMKSPAGSMAERRERIEALLLEKEGLSG